MSSDILQKSALAAMLEAYLVTLTAPVVRLFKDVISLTPTTNLLGLTQPVGTWYTPIAVVFGQVFELPDGSIKVVGASVQFNYTGASAAEIITGYYTVDPGSPDVPVAANMFPTPISMGNLLDSIVVLPTIILPPVLGS